MREVRGETGPNRKAPVTTTLYNHGEQKSISKHTSIFEADELNLKFHSSQPRTWIGGYTGYRIAQTAQLTSWSVRAWLTGQNFWMIGLRQSYIWWHPCILFMFSVSGIIVKCPDILHIHCMRKYTCSYTCIFLANFSHHRTILEKNELISLIKNEFIMR